MEYMFVLIRTDKSSTWGFISNKEWNWLLVWRFNMYDFYVFCREQQVNSEMKFKIRKVRPMRIESFRRKSLEDVLDSTQRAVRKDSVVSLKMDGNEAKSSLIGSGMNSFIIGRL